MKGVALGLQKQCHFVPPLKAVIDRVLTLTESYKARYVSEYSEHKLISHKSLFLKSTPEVLLQLHEQYGWDDYKQRIFANFVASLNLGDDNDHPFSQLLYDRDTSAAQLVFAA